ncbi:NAD(P)-dependent dehydrogenase, short-chain alcohol dehydrogenase family [Frankineae bacterium MT45]|nr:NAD(P)-dependent dehydrogenase, short-chain alcohol dehydrogenase family [Frankineae bacterium MT45]
MTTTLVTGATRGVGLEVSRRLAQAGHTVYLGARDLDRGREVAEPIGARAIAIDVTDDTSVRAAIDQINREVGALDVLVNNAGIAGTQRPPAEADVDDLTAVLATNVVGATRVLVACIPLLEQSASPVIVNVSSAVGSLALNAKPDAAWSIVAYPMSKAALNMLTVQYARAFSRWRINSVTPGLTLTEFNGRPTDSIDLDAFRRAGGRTVEEAVEVLVEMATIGPDGPTGTFVGNDGPLPW